MVALHQGGFLYGVDGHGPADADLVCVDAATGKEQWRTQPEWKVKAADLTVMTRQLSVMVSSGMTLLRAFYVLEEQQENKLLSEEERSQLGVGRCTHGA